MVIKGYGTFIKQKHWTQNYFALKDWTILFLNKAELCAVFFGVHALHLKDSATCFTLSNLKETIKLQCYSLLVQQLLLILSQNRLQVLARVTLQSSEAKGKEALFEKCLYQHWVIMEYGASARATASKTNKSKSLNYKMLVGE